MRKYGEIGVNIVLVRNQKGMTQECLALRAGISVSRLRDIEHGTANYTRDTMRQIAETLEMPEWTLTILFLEDQMILEMVHSAREMLGLWVQEENMEHETVGHL